MTSLMTHIMHHTYHTEARTHLPLVNVTYIYLNIRCYTSTVFNTVFGEILMNKHPNLFGIERTLKQHRNGCRQGRRQVE